MNILVTGAAGFIGSYLTRALVSKGHSVCGLDNFDSYYDRRAKELNVDLTNLHAGVNLRFADKRIVRDIYSIVSESPLYSRPPETGKFYFYEGDITDEGLLEDLFKRFKFNVIVHLAAMAGVPKSIEDPRYYSRVNVDGTINLLELARKSNVSKFIFGSSSSVYGDRAEVPFKETEDITKPVSPYAATKIAGEVICYCYHHLYSIETVIIRIFGPVFGPLQRPYGMFIQRAIKFIDNDLPVIIYGRSGWKMSRDCTYIDDEVGGIMLSLEKNLNFEIINIGSGKPKTLKEQLGAVEKAMGKKANISYVPKKKTEVSITYADISKAKKILGFTPKTDFYEGVQKQYQVYKIMPDWYKIPDKL